MNRSEESARQDLLRLEREKEIDREFVAKEVGDLPMSSGESELHKRIRNDRGDRFFADLLFVLSNANYHPAKAARLWPKLLVHKEEMDRALGRNVGISVAALDFLTNVRGDLSSPVLLEEEQLVSFAELGTKDAMTGLSDHSTFQMLLHKEIERAIRHTRSVSVIMLDVDHFKLFNDRCGHPAGDRVLIDIARLMEEEARTSDTACRYGGEEFAIVCPDTDSDEAYALAERLRRAALAALESKGISVSLGISTFPTNGRRVKEVVSAADQALYQSKRSGRNCTRIARSREREKLS